MKHKSSFSGWYRQKNYRISSFLLRYLHNDTKDCLLPHFQCMESRAQNKSTNTCLMEISYTLFNCDFALCLYLTGFHSNYSSTFPFGSNDSLCIHRYNFGIRSTVRNFIITVWWTQLRLQLRCLSSQEGNRRVNTGYFLSWYFWYYYCNRYFLLPDFTVILAVPVFIPLSHLWMIQWQHFYLKSYTLFFPGKLLVKALVLM